MPGDALMKPQSISQHMHAEATGTGVMVAVEVDLLVKMIDCFLGLVSLCASVQQKLPAPACSLNTTCERCK